MSRERAICTGPCCDKVARSTLWHFTVSFATLLTVNAFIISIILGTMYYLAYIGAV